MFKRLTILLGFCVFLLITLLALATVLLSPRDFNMDVAELLSEHTGREVRIIGDVQYEFFPWLGIRARQVLVQQPQGMGPGDFGDEPFLLVREARLRVRLVPLLLRQEVVPDHIEVLQPRFTFYKTADGRNNWDDLLQRLQQSASPDSGQSTPDDEPPLQASDWQGITLEQGHITYVDEESNEVLTLENLNLRTTSGARFDYSFSCSLSSKRHEAVAEVSMQGESILSLTPLNLQLQDAAINLEGLAFVNGVTRYAGFSGLADADLQQESLELKQATLRLEGLRLDGKLTGEDLLQDSFALQGELSLEECSPDSPLEGRLAGFPLCKLLENMAVSTAFSASARGIKLVDLRLVMPGADLVAQSELQLPEPLLNLELRGNSLDLDTLMQDVELPEGEGPLPAWLLSWPGELPPANISCDLERFHASGVTLMDMRLQATTSPGQLQLQLERARFLGGELQAGASASKGQLYVKTSLQQADANALSTLLFGAEHMQGVITLQGEASSQGETAQQLWRNLRLQTSLQLSESALDFTSPPKVLGQSPQPGFRFKSCSAELAMSCADLDAPGSRLPFTFTASTTFDQLQPQGIFEDAVRGREYGETVNGSLDVRGTAYVDAVAPDFLGVENAAVSLEYHGPGTHIWPGRHWDFTGQGTGRVDMAEDVLSIQNISGSLPNFPVQGSLVIEHAFKPGPPSRYSGTLVAPDFQPRQALPLFEVQPPQTSEASALQQGALDLTYLITERKMDIEVLQLQVDRTSIAGNVSLEGLDRPGPLLHRFELRADELDLDAYLPPDAAEGEEEAAWSSAWLEDLVLQGGVSIDEFRVMDLRYDSLHASVEAENGGLRLRPVTSRFYGGEFFGVVGVHTLPRKQGLGVTMESSIADFKLQDVIQDLGGSDIVGGNASWDMNLAGGGKSMRNLMQTLSGKARFRVEDGFYTFKGGKSRSPSSKGDGMLTSRKSRPASDTSRTRFSHGAATFIVQNGQVRNDDFVVDGLIMRAEGSGTASLPARTLDYTLLVQMTGAPTIPIHIHGAFADLDVEVTQRGMLTDTVGRLGGSVFNVFKSILTLPFWALEALGDR